MRSSQSTLTPRHVHARMDQRLDEAGLAAELEAAPRVRRTLLDERRLEVDPDVFDLALLRRAQCAA